MGERFALVGKQCHCAVTPLSRRMANVKVPFNLKLIAILLGLLVIVGIAGFHLIEGWSYFDGFYMVLTTITSIGYGEIHPLSHAGRLFNSFVIITGVGLVLLLVGGASRTLLEFEIQSLFGRRSMDREIRRLTGHFIICGAGRVGRSVARELARRPLPFVVVDTSEEKLQKYASEGWPTLRGDATQAPVLHELRIEHAQGLVAATTTDAINIYIILTARSLNPNLKIIARAAEEEAEKHLLTAGADSVVSPYRFAGYRIAQTFMRPNRHESATSAGDRRSQGRQRREVCGTNARRIAHPAGIRRDCACHQGRAHGDAIQSSSGRGNSRGRSPDRHG